MQVERTVNFNTKLQSLMQYASWHSQGDSSLFENDFPQISSDMIKNLLSNGSSVDMVVSQLVDYIGIDADNESLSEILTNALGKIVKSVQRDLSESELDEITQTQESKESPIDEFEFDWNLEDSGELFSENIQRDNFIQNFEQLNTSTNENDYFTNYLNAINEIGADNFFDILDEDNDGSLSADELSILTNSDENNSSITANEFNNVYNKYLQSQNSEDLTNSEQSNSQEAQQPVKDVDNKTKTHSSSAGNSYNAVQNTDNAQNAETEPKETVEDLVKQKQQILTEADTKITEFNTQIDSLINNSTLKQELKDNYNTAKQEYDNNENSITEYETKIQEYDLNLHNIERSLAALEGEKSTISTNTSDSELNTKNKYRLQAIETKIQELTSQQETLEQEKSTAQAEQDSLKSNSETLKANFEAAQTALENELPETIKNQIDSLKAQIEAVKTERASKVAEINSKIESLKTQEIQESRDSGEATGKMESNPIGSKFVEEALKYNGTKGGALFSTGNYGWCADFVTYVVRQVAMQTGMSKEEARQLAHEHLGASPQKLHNKNNQKDAQGKPLHIIETDGLSTSTLQKKVQPGMAFICKGGGASGQHTGFVAEVYDDGTFLSIEGNHGNKVCQVRRNLTDMYSYVDFSYLFV